VNPARSSFLRATALVVAVLVLAAGSCQSAGEPGESSESGSGNGTTSARSECPRKGDPVTGPIRKNPTSTAPADAEIVVDASSDRGSIHPGVFGVNHRYPYNGFDMWDPAGDRPHPLFVDRFEHAGITEVRFPGGRTANNYHWRRSIGPPEDRGLHVDAAFGRIPAYREPLTNEFGVDEFGRFLEAVGSNGTMVVNFTTGSADEAADWLEYMNTPLGQNPRGGTAWAEVRATNGHPEPYGVTHWEIGNELAGAKTFWLGDDATEREKVEKYVFGGSTSFERDTAVGYVDYTPDASLSTGRPNQRFFVRFPPIGRGSDEVFVGEEVWNRVDSLSHAGPDDEVYEIDYRRGMIRFGDGEHGAIPNKSSRITITYVSGPHDGFVDFYREMKEVDPEAQIGSAFNSPHFLEMMGTAHPFDFYVAHSYSFFHEDPSDMEELHDLMMTLPDDQASKVRASKDAIARYMGAEKAAEIGVVISEWAMSTGKNLGIRQVDYVPDDYPMSLDGAIYIALVLQQWLDLGIEVAEKHSLIDVNIDDLPRGYDKSKTAYQALIGAYPCFVLTPSALVFRIFTTMTGDRLVGSEVAGNPTKTIFSGAPLEYLRTTASEDEEGNLYLIVINRSGDEAVPAKVTMTGFERAGSATVWSLGGRDNLAVNTERRPNRVRIKEAELRSVQSGFTYLFPKHSVTAFRFEG
jgi:alpha-L-arabinofuranosidase